MGGAFDDREDAFEKRFASDEATRFRALARRNKAVGLWAAGLMKREGEAASAYAIALATDFAGCSDDEVAGAVRAGLEQAGVEVSDHRVRRRMDEALAEALAAIRRGD